MVNRRAFLSIGAGAAVFGARALAMPGDKFRWAMSSHMFTPMKPHPESGIKMAARFGFHGSEPWGNELEYSLNRPPEVFKAVLDESGIGISSVASGGQYLDTTKLASTI